MATRVNNRGFPFAMVAAFAVFAMVLAAACGEDRVVTVEKEVVKEVEVPGETVVVEKVVVEEVEVPGETVVVEKVVEVEVPGETVVVEKVVVEEVEVPGETVVVEKVVEVEVPGETVVVEKVVEKVVEVEVPGETVVVEKEVAAPAEEKVLRMSWNVAPSSINPLTGGNAIDGLTFNFIHSRLLQPDPVNGRWAPDLAERWEVAPDGSSYTFYLRKNAFWHDGTPVTAKDVAFSYKLGLNLETGTFVSGYLTSIKGAVDYTEGRSDDVPGIVVVDDHTIRFDQEFNNALFVENAVNSYQLVIMPEHILGDVPPGEINRHPNFQAPIGSGPFKFSRFVPDQLLEVEANPDYYFGRPKIDRIVFHIIKSTDATQVAMQRGEIDIAFFDGAAPTTEMFEAAIRDPRLNVVAAEGNLYWYVAWNHRVEELRDPRVRQAIAHAIDRQALIDNFNQGNGGIRNSFFYHKWYAKPEWDTRYQYDPDRARELLQDAGWDPNREVVFSTFPQGSAEKDAMFAAMQQMLADVGIKIKIEFTELSAIVDLWLEEPLMEGVDMIYSAHVPPPDPDGILQGRNRTGSKWGEALGHVNAELDAKMDLGARTIKQEDRIPIYQEVAEDFIEKLYWLPIFKPDGWWIMSNKLVIPTFSALSQAANLFDVPITPSFINSFDHWKYHLEEWDIVR